MDSMYGKHGLRLGNLADVADAIVAVNASTSAPLVVQDIFGWAIEAEKYLYDCGISPDLAKGTVAVITTSGEPEGGRAVIGNEVVLRRAANDWRLMSIGHVICYPGSEGSFDVIFSDLQHFAMREAMEYAEAA